MSRITLDYLKHTLDIFFRESELVTKSLRLGRRNVESRINESIYELESHLSALKKQYDINLSLNADISSEAIRQSFQNEQASFLRAVDYQLNFLLYLACQHKPEKELRQYINEFLELSNEHLSWADLVITETDVTRAKTNLRFAVNSLRKAGLLPPSKTEGNSLLPSMYGLWVLYTIRTFTPYWSEHHHPLSREGIRFRSMPGFTEHSKEIEMARIDLKNPDFFQVVVETAVEEGFPVDTAQHILALLSAERQAPRFDMDVFLARLGADEPVTYRLPLCEILQKTP
jgi:hypothetical protein